MDSEPQTKPDAMADSAAAAATPSIVPQDSTVTKLEKAERELVSNTTAEFEQSPAKRVKLEDKDMSTPVRRKGVASIKPEFLLQTTGSRLSERGGAERDDAAEASGNRYPADDRSDKRGNGRDGRDKKNKQKGQNTNRNFGSSRDKIQLCNSRATAPEFSPDVCQFGDRCRLEHDLRKYLKDGKFADLTVLDGMCPTWDSRGVCPAGWKCRFLGSHSEERETEDGRKELVLTEDLERKAKAQELPSAEDEVGVVNVVSKDAKIKLQKRITKTPNSDAYIEYTNKLMDESRKKNEEDAIKTEDDSSIKNEDDDASIKKAVAEDNRALYIEPPFLPSEKRRIYYGPETPVLAPLTTQGNLPFRRLCVELGAQITWSEMAMGMPLIQGERSEWALMKAHESEIRPPKFTRANSDIVTGYDNSKDIKFGAQISANKPWLALKATEILTSHCANLRAIDLNCGCPIELVCRTGAGSALLDNASKLENILRGMNAVSQEVPITVKIRMGTKDSSPTADKLVKRLVLGGYEAVEAGLGTSGVAAITLHGRSKQQRYTKSANWNYIAECAALISRLKKERYRQTDTVKEADARHQANNGKVYFVGNGDCYSHVDYQTHLDEAKVDSVMVARGALIKPWIFEEIEKGQYLDKSASERLTYIEKFVKYGLQNWGSDEIGVGTTRKFLMEWLSFACRYVPIGMLEHLPPNLQDRAPAFKGRDDLETLMSSDNYKDWIKISEMFLGPTHPNFRFEPKHKSNAYEIQAEG